MRHRIALTAVLALAVLSFQPTAQAAASTASRLPTATRTPITPNGSWTTYHHDDGHTGYDPTLSTVRSVSTGWTTNGLDQQIYAEPLVYGGIVYTATLNNTVYALNQTDGSIVWQRNIGAPETGGWVCGNVSPQGILGTPVIDPATGRIYVAAQFAVDDVYRLVGLNLATGAIELTTKMKPSGFDWTIQQERGALVVHGGRVYVPFGGRAGDCGVYHGWVVGVLTSGSKTLSVYRTPGNGNGMWAAGGIVVDDSTGNVFAATGNGNVSAGCNAISGKPQYENDAVVRLSPTLVHTSYFMPQDWQAHWCANDQDLGSASPLLISPSILFQSGKWGTGFLLDPTNLGGIDGQRFPTPKPAVYAEANVCFGNHGDATFGSFAYASPFIYVECEGRGLVALNVDTSVAGKPTFSPCDTCAAPDWKSGSPHTFGPPIVAAGAVWVADYSGSTGLWAFNAATGALIFHSGGFGVNRFVTPAEAGGQVFVPSLNRIRSFHVFTAVPPQAPTAVQATAGDASATVAWTPSTFDAGAPVTSFTITANVGGVVQLAETIFEFVTSANFPGLTNGTTYTFQVIASNIAGDSSPSADSNSVTPPRQAGQSSPVPPTSRPTDNPGPTPSPPPGR